MAPLVRRVFAATVWVVLASAPRYNVHAGDNNGAGGTSLSIQALTDQWSSSATSSGATGHHSDSVESEHDVGVGVPPRGSAFAALFEQLFGSGAAAATAAVEQPDSNSKPVLDIGSIKPSSKKHDKASDAAADVDSKADMNADLLAVDDRSLSPKQLDAEIALSNGGRSTSIISLSRAANSSDMSSFNNHASANKQDNDGVANAGVNLQEQNSSATSVDAQRLPNPIDPLSLRPDLLDIIGPSAYENPMKKVCGPNLGSGYPAVSGKWDLDIDYSHFFPYAPMTQMGGGYDGSQLWRKDEEDGGDDNNADDDEKYRLLRSKHAPDTSWQRFDGGALAAGTARGTLDIGNQSPTGFFDAKLSWEGVKGGDGAAASAAEVHLSCAFSSDSKHAAADILASGRAVECVPLYISVAGRKLLSTTELACSKYTFTFSDFILLPGPPFLTKMADWCRATRARGFGTLSNCGGGEPPLEFVRDASGVLVSYRFPLPASGLQRITARRGFPFNG